MFGKDQLLRLALRNRVRPRTRRPFCGQSNGSVNAAHRFKCGERTTRLAEQNLSVHKDLLAQKDWQKLDPVGKCIWARLFSPLILRRTDPADTQSQIWRKSGCLY